MGFENVLRSIVGLEPRIGEKHGIEKENGTYDKKHSGSEKPTDY